MKGGLTLGINVHAVERRSQNRKIVIKSSGNNKSEKEKVHNSLVNTSTSYISPTLVNFKILSSFQCNNNIVSSTTESPNPMGQTSPTFCSI
jgi:hypothetical protein